MENHVFVTVIMPIRNEASFIRRSLGRVLEQDYPADRMEVIVADGMSDDDTRQIVAALQAENDSIHLVDNPGRIVPTGINAALRRARGGIIVRVDGHTEISQDYVRQCVAELHRTHADNVGGRMCAVTERPFGRAVAQATSTPFGVGGARFHYSHKEEWVDTVYMGAWPRKVFERIGLFDEELVRDQDDEFNYRLLSHGGRILLSARIRSCYYVRATPASLWRQYSQYGFWKVRVMQKHPSQIRLRQLVPSAFAAALLISILCTLFWRYGWVLLVAVGGAYCLANLAATAWTSLRNREGYLFLLPLVYLILHLSYGLGFLLGLIRFADRWGDRQGQVPQSIPDAG